MTEDRFWQLIEQHVEVEEGEDVDVSDLESALRRLSPAEIVSFGEIFRRLHRSAYSWNLWGAAYLMNGGCSDDSFAYFRGWLIAQGRTVFERAVRDPDSLVHVNAGSIELEEMLSLAAVAYEELTGEDIPLRPEPLPDLGEGWDFDDADEMKRRYPRLAAQY